MYRPWWFPEYNPWEQRIFDTIVSILTKNFEKRNYQHIMTPAVEPVDILTRGGDIGDKQVYWLYGLAQGNEDTKDYALHFDLTVPFARYVLDHMNDLVFPFKRYQMQPVRRGERTKRGRYKEFRQFDVDTIRRTDTDVGSWYDAESIIVCYQSLQEIFATMNVKKNVVVKLSNIWVTKRYLTSLGILDDKQLSVCKLLDDYFKIWHQTFVEKASAFADATALQKIETLLQTHDYSVLSSVEWFEFLDQTIKALKQYNVNVQYDIAIIRWHNYYTWTVVEFFLEDDMEIWAIAWWWAYNWLTDFINPKHSFSGVGCSISSRIMEVILSLWWWLKSATESYMFINFPDTLHETVGLMQRFHTAWKNCEIYPTPAKLWKQFEYADKKWIPYCIVFGKDEADKWVFLIKDMKDGSSFEWTFDQSYWIIPLCEIDGIKKVALVKHKAWHRWFPKWHAESWESILETAKRECGEETWLSNLLIDEKQCLEEHYFISDRKKAIPIIDNNRGILKSVWYFIGNVQWSNTLTTPKDELLDAQWYSLEEAMQLAMYPQMKEILKQASKYF